MERQQALPSDRLTSCYQMVCWSGHAGVGHQQKAKSLALKWGLQEHWRWLPAHLPGSQLTCPSVLLLSLPTRQP